MNVIQQFLQDNNLNGFDKDGGTDKDVEHSYCPFYEKIFRDYISDLEISSVLEIGTYKGGWAYTMHQLLPLSTIYTIDIEDNFSSTLSQKMKTRFLPCIRDAYTEEAIKSFGDVKFDLIIDDGPHTVESQIWTIKNYLSLLQPDGLMLIEDVCNENANTLLKEVPGNRSATVYDMRSNKNRWDDIIIAIE